MDEQAASVQLASKPAPAPAVPAPSPVPAPPESAPPESAPLWHLGWMVGVVAAGAALEAGLGAISWPTLIALLCGAAPGLVGYLWRPTGRERLGLLVIWSLGTVAAASFEGGLIGPLGLWCAMPLLAGALIGATAEGAVLGAAALLVIVLVELSGLAAPEPRGLFGLGVSALGLLTIGGAAAGVLAILAARARERAATAAAEHNWLSTVMSELPHLALALDPEGRTEAVFGAPIEGLEFERLQAGLVEATFLEDRERVRAALCEALDHGAGATEFRAAAAPARWLALALRRRGEDGLAALVRETAPTADAETRRLTALVEERAAAEAAALARVHALEQKLKTTERARNQAFNALTEAEAARTAAEAARDAAEANAVGKSRFLANMSHELRTPLNAIMGFSDVMRTRMFGDLLPRYAEYAELIQESGRHLVDLINDVLDMSKIEASRYSLSREVFDAREAINAALRLVRLQADDAGVTLRGLSPTEPLMVDADRRALKQIVLNLVSNALKFTPAEGMVTVTAQAVGDMFELVVADTGVGIAKDDLERLGRPFEQAGDAEHKAQGTGLGLSLVKAFARLQGGEMNIESELGEGAAVTVRLPILVAAEPAVEAAPEAAPEPLVDEPVIDAPAEAVAAAPIATVVPMEPSESSGRPDGPPQPRMGEVIPLNLLR